MRSKNQTIIQAFTTHITLFLCFASTALSAEDATQPAVANLPPATTGLSDAIDAADNEWGDSAYELMLEGYDPGPVVPAKAWNDLLERIRNNFDLSWEMNARVEQELNWFLRHPDYLDRVFKRSQRYLPHIAAELDRRGLPQEIALLPIVESAFDPFAYSHGRAAGLWQIIPGTGRRFDVRQNWWYDGRRDILDSTRAALDYLTALHKMMDGDWLLAIASYNSGEGNVLRGIRRNRRAGKPTDFWNISVPRETSTYVPRLLALVALVRDPDAYGIKLPTVVDEAQFDVVDFDSQVDLALAAELAGTDVDTLYSFNPGFNQWATDPEGPHRLVLPAGLGAEFAEALEQVPVDQRVRWKRHRVRSGQTLSEIADHYKTTLAQIRSANNLRGNMIRAGSFLMIPVAAEPLTAYSKSADARREQIQNRSRSGSRVEHIVASGESFWTISRRYGVGVRELAAWNAMAPRDTLSIGQKLVIWTENGQASLPRPTANQLTRKLRYTVRTGDSLSRIANRFRVSIADLVRWNGIDRNNILRPGQKLTMFVDVTNQSS